MANEIQFARITNAGKLADRFLTCRHIKSDDLAKSHMGEIFAVAEILSPWFPTARVGQLILNNFAKYYWQGGSTSDLVNFESSLKRVNEDLAQITQSGETDWIGNLNAILATIVGGNLHFAPTGKVEAYIFREGKVNHLTYGLQTAAESHPLKTFSNIVSGELKARDMLLFTNNELFNHLSLESIRQIITLNNPSLAALQITRLLRKEKVRNANLIIINLVSKEELSDKTPEDQETVYYLDKSTESIMANLGKFWSSILSPLGKIFGKGIKNSFKFLATKISRKKVLQEKVPEKEDRFHKEFIKSEIRDDGLLKDEEIKYSPEYVHYYSAENAKNAKNASKTAKEEKKGGRWILGKIKWFLGKMKLFGMWIVKIARDRYRRKYLFIALAIILILIVALATGIRGKSSKVGNLQAQKILDEAYALQKDGKSLMLSGNQEEAKAKFVSSIKKGQEIMTNPLVVKDAQGVIATSYQELDKLTSTTRLTELQPLATVASPAKGLFIVSGAAYILTDNDIFEANIMGGTPSKIASLAKVKGNFVTGARREKTLYLYTSDQKLYEFDPSSKKIGDVKIAEGAHWETANSIVSYVGTIYLLDGVLGQIYKHSSSQEEFQKGEEYISTVNIDLKQSISMSIDGSIYVLKKNGKVIKLQRSKLQDFSLKGIPTPFDQITDPIKIYTDADTPSIYVLDGGQKRILEFDKEGRFVHQYALPEGFDKIKDFVVSIKSRKIWILQKDSLYEISI